MNNSNNRFLQSNLQSNDLATETTLKDIDQVLRDGIIDISGNIRIMNDPYSTRRQQLQFSGSDNLAVSVGGVSDTSFNNTEFDNLLVYRVVYSIFADGIDDMTDFGASMVLANPFKLFYKVNSGDSKHFLTGDITTNRSLFAYFEDVRIERGFGNNEDAMICVTTFPEPLYIDSNSGGEINIEYSGAADLSDSDFIFCQIQYRGYSDF